MFAQVRADVTPRCKRSRCVHRELQYDPDDELPLHRHCCGWSQVAKTYPVRTGMPGSSRWADTPAAVQHDIEYTVCRERHVHLEIESICLHPETA